MSIRKNTNPIPLDIQPELQDILVRNGMRAHIRGSSNGFQLVVQGHDSPLLCYPISEKQLKDRYGERIFSRLSDAKHSLLRRIPGKDLRLK